MYCKYKVEWHVSVLLLAVAAAQIWYCIWIPQQIKYRDAGHHLKLCTQPTQTLDHRIEQETSGTSLGSTTLSAVQHITYLGVQSNSFAKTTLIWIRGPKPGPTISKNPFQPILFLLLFTPNRIKMKWVETFFFKWAAQVWDPRGQSCVTLPKAPSKLHNVAAWLRASDGKHKSCNFTDTCGRVIQLCPRWDPSMMEQWLVSDQKVSTVCFCIQLQSAFGIHGNLYSITYVLQYHSVFFSLGGYRVSHPCPLRLPPYPMQQLRWLFSNWVATSVASYSSMPEWQCTQVSNGWSRKKLLLLNLMDMSIQISTSKGCQFYHVWWDLTTGPVDLPRSYDPAKAWMPRQYDPARAWMPGIMIQQIVPNSFLQVFEWFNQESHKSDTVG